MFFPTPIANPSLYLYFTRHYVNDTPVVHRYIVFGTPLSRRRRALQPGDRGDAPGAAAGEAREMKQSLQRTRKMMAEQLARVAQVSEVMGAQDALLKDTFAEHQASFP